MTKLKYIYQIETKQKNEYNKITSKLDTVEERKDNSICRTEKETQIYRTVI